MSSCALSLTIIASVSNGGLGSISVSKLSSFLKAADHGLYLSVRRFAGAHQAHGSVRRFSALGEHGAIWLALGVGGGALDRPRRRCWARATAVVAGSYVLSSGLKCVVRRKRPDFAGLPPLMKTPTQLSFPSSHAVTSFAAVQAFTGLVPKGVLYPLASGLAFSRLYLGVHYPSDIAFGALLGSAVGRLSRKSRYPQIHNSSE